MAKNNELLDIFNAALAAVDPYRAVLNSVRLEQNSLHVGAKVYELEKYARIVVVGAGKATARMAMAIETLGQWRQVDYIEYNLSSEKVGLPQPDPAMLFFQKTPRATF